MPVEYENVDPAAEAADLRNQRASSLEWEVWLREKIDGPVMAGLAKDKSLTAQQKSTVDQQKARGAEEAAERKGRRDALVARGAQVADITDEKRAWLTERVTSLEREHAQLSEIAEHADEYGADADEMAWNVRQVEEHLKVAKAELAKLG